MLIIDFLFFQQKETIDSFRKTMNSSALLQDFKILKNQNFKVVYEDSFLFDRLIKSIVVSSQ